MATALVIPPKPEDVNADNVERALSIVTYELMDLTKKDHVAISTRVGKGEYKYEIYAMYPSGRELLLARGNEVECYGYLYKHWMGLMFPKAVAAKVEADEEALLKSIQGYLHSLSVNHNGDGMRFEFRKAGKDGLHRAIRYDSSGEHILAEGSLKDCERAFQTEFYADNYF